MVWPELPCNYRLSLVLCSVLCGLRRCGLWIGTMLGVLQDQDHCCGPSATVPAYFLHLHWFWKFFSHSFFSIEILKRSLFKGYKPAKVNQNITNYYLEGKKNTEQMSSMLSFSKLITVLTNERFRLRHTFNQCFYVRVEPSMYRYLCVCLLRLVDVWTAGQVFV